MTYPLGWTEPLRQALKKVSAYLSDIADRLDAIESSPGATSWDASGSDIHNTNSGNVGVGTSNPDWPLVVADSSTAIAQMNGGAAGAAQLRLTSDSENRRVVATDASGMPVNQVIFADDEITFCGVTVTDEVMRVDTANERVGIRTSSPDGRLHVAFADSDATAFVIDRDEGNSQTIKAWTNTSAHWVRGFGDKAFVLDTSAGQNVQLRVGNSIQLILSETYAQFPILAGSGTRMVVVDASGNLSTQPLP